MPKGNMKYDYNRGFFKSISTAEQAYILGFITADGHVRANGHRISFCLSATDHQILSAISLHICGVDLVRQKQYIMSGKLRDVVYLDLNGYELVNDLNALGLFHDKTTTAVYPIIPKEFDRDFIRGVWDGDGGVYAREFNVFGASQAIMPIRQKILDHTGRELSFFTKQNGIVVAGYRRDKEVVNWLYQTPSLVIERKYAAYIKYWT